MLKFLVFAYVLLFDYQRLVLAFNMKSQFNSSSTVVRYCHFEVSPVNDSEISFGNNGFLYLILEKISRIVKVTNEFPFICTGFVLDQLANLYSVILR